MERFDIEQVIRILGLEMRAKLADEGRDFDVACRIAIDKLRKCKEYEDLEEQGLLPKLPCKVGDMVYVNSETMPIGIMDFGEVKDIPLYFKAIVVSFRKNSNGIYIKLKVKAKWYKWIDGFSDSHEADKYFTYSLSAIGKTVFLTQAEAEEALKKMEKETEK